MQIHSVKSDRASLPTRGIKGSPAIWIQEKKIRDTQLWGNDTTKYWIIENKLYDLASFLDKHPGGRNWLTMTQGQDVTDFFIIHHLNEDKARKELAKYYVGETKNKLARYTFEEDGLYRTVKRRLLKEMTPFEVQDQTQSKRFGLIILTLFCLFLGLTINSINAESPSLWSYFFAAICSLLLVGAIGIGHNFIHHKANYYKYFFVLSGFTHDQWQIMHCLSHHIYPNTELDFQAAALEPIAFFLRVCPPNKVYTEPLLICLFIFIQPINMVLKTVIVPIIKRRAPDLWYAVPILVFLLFYWASNDLWYAFKLHLFLYGLFGLLFNRVLFCGHRLQQLWTEGAERIDDFGEHTILSTSDTDVGLQGFFSYLLLGGFNIHTPHHFFPTADHAALPRILKIIDDTCKQKGIRHITNTRMACFKSLSKGIISRIPFVRK